MRKSITKVSCRILSLRKVAEEVKCRNSETVVYRSAGCSHLFAWKIFSEKHWNLQVGPGVINWLTRALLTSHPWAWEWLEPRGLWASEQGSHVFTLREGPRFCDHLPPSYSPRPLFIRVSVFQMPSFLFPSSVGVQGVSEPSKEKLKVCNEWRFFWFYNDPLFRSKTSSRLYVPDFARAKWYSKRLYGLSHRVAVVKNWHKLLQNEPWKSPMTFLTCWREQKKRLNSAIVYCSLNGVASFCFWIPESWQ